MFFRDEGPKTTTILTIDLPVALGDRLRQVMRLTGRRSLSKVALEALQAWVERQEHDLENPPPESGAEGS
jgi:hypothetical protein